MTKENQAYEFLFEFIATNEDLGRVDKDTLLKELSRLKQQPASPGWKEFKRDMYDAVAPPQPIACEQETDSQSIGCELLEYATPHPSGGTCYTRLTKHQATEYQKKYAKKEKGYTYESDKAALDDFIVCHHAHYITTDTEEASE